MIQVVNYDKQELGTLIIKLSEFNVSRFITTVNSFQFWLLTNDKLKWKIELKEGIHRTEEVEHPMSYEEYWNSEKKYILQDMSEYVTNYYTNKTTNK